MVSEVAPKLKGRTKAHRWRLFATLLALILLLLLCNFGIQPFVAILDAWDRANSGVFEFDDIQVAVTNTNLVSHRGVTSLDNCNGENGGSWLGGIATANGLEITIAEPFNTSTGHQVLEDKYKATVWGQGKKLFFYPAIVSDPGTNMQFIWTADEQQWTGYVTSKSQAGKSAYLVSRWLQPKLISSKNLGCEF
jgi:hypothetical protein